VTPSAMLGDAPGPGRVSNPFATRFTRPGAIPPLDDEGGPLDVASLFERAMSAGPVVVIEGAHGTGKTTLLVALLARAAANRRRMAFVRAASVADAWTVAAAIGGASRDTVIGLDGGERLPVGAFTLVRVLARLRGVVVLATTHRPVGLPVLARCRSTPRLLAAVVGHLPTHGGRIDGSDINEAFGRHGGDLREALFDLYDRFERRDGRG